MVCRVQACRRVGAVQLPGSPRRDAASGGSNNTVAQERGGGLFGSGLSEERLRTGHTDWVLSSQLPLEWRVQEGPGLDGRPRETIFRGKAHPPGLLIAGDPGTGDGAKTGTLTLNSGVSAAEKRPLRTPAGCSRCSSSSTVQCSPTYLTLVQHDVMFNQL